MESQDNLLSSIRQELSSESLGNVLTKVQAEIDGIDVQLDSLLQRRAALRTIYNQFAGLGGNPYPVISTFAHVNVDSLTKTALKNLVLKEATDLMASGLRVTEALVEQKLREKAILVPWHNPRATIATILRKNGWDRVGDHYVFPISIG
jgi:hypothetical protein